MAKVDYLVHIDLAKNELLNAKLQNKAGVHPTVVAGVDNGFVYWNTTDLTAYVYTGTGTTWLDLGQEQTDGDYGDITVSGSGTVWTIDDDSVTYAKMQNAVADQVILGNIGGAGGVIAELTKAQVLTLLNVEDGADVTDATNVDAAGAVMESDISGTPSGRIIDDDTFVTASNTTLATSESTKAYIDAQIVGGMTFIGDYNATTNTPDLDTSPSGSILTGDTYVVSVAGDFFTEAVQVGDQLMAKQDAPTLLAHWSVVNKNIPDIVDASETASGIVEEATDAEVTSGAATGGTGAKLFVTPAKLKTHLGETGTLDSALTYTQLVGDAAATSIVVTHSIGRQNVQTQLFRVSTGDEVKCEVENTSTTTTTLGFNTAPTLNQFRVVIQG